MENSFLLIGILLLLTVLQSTACSPSWTGGRYGPYGSGVHGAQHHRHIEQHSLRSGLGMHHGPGGGGFGRHHMGGPPGPGPMMPHGGPGGLAGGFRPGMMDYGHRNLDRGRAVSHRHVTRHRHAHHGKGKTGRRHHHYSSSGHRHHGHGHRHGHRHHHHHHVSSPLFVSQPMGVVSSSSWGDIFGLLFFVIFTFSVLAFFHALLDGYSYYEDYDYYYDEFGYKKFKKGKKE